jgi:hypothetical protein
MKRFAIIAMALTLSQLSYANPATLSTKIFHKLQDHQTQTTTPNNMTNQFVLIYGGQDIANSRVASANDNQHSHIMNLS